MLRGVNLFSKKGPEAALTQHKTLQLTCLKSLVRESSQGCEAPLFGKTMLFYWFGKGVFEKSGVFRKVHFPEILENLEILEFIEIPPVKRPTG